MGLFAWLARRFAPKEEVRSPPARPRATVTVVPEATPAALRALPFSGPSLATLAPHLEETAARLGPGIHREVLVRLHHMVSVEGVNLPAIPESIVKVQRLVGRPDCALSDLERALAREPVLQTKLIGIANSPFYLSQVPARSVRDAVMRIGLGETRNVALTLACQAKIFRIPSNPGLAERLYARAVAVAHAAKLIADHGRSDRDDAFLVGLAHDLARIVVHNAAYEVHRQQKGQAQLEVAVVESIADELSAPLSARIAESWNLEPQIVRAIEWQHFPASAPESAAGLTIPLADAKVLVRTLEGDPSPGTPIGRPFDGALLDAFAYRLREIGVHFGLRAAA